jgi:hypothetical protein
VRKSFSTASIVATCEPDPDDPFDQFGFHAGHFAPQIGNFDLGCEVRPRA